MSNRSADLFLADIHESIARIERYSAGLDRAGFEADEKTVDAVVRNLEIIGEAARQLPEDFTQRNPQIEWRKIAGLRNRIVHDYFGLDLEIIWHIVRSDLPALKRDLPPGAMGTHCAGRSFRRGQFHLRRTGGRSHSGQPRRHAVSLLSSTLPNWPSGSGRFFSMP